MIDPSAQDIGREVVYVGTLKGTGQPGTITSFNKHYVFVRYGTGDTSAATRREDLEWFDD